jgi:hypothetical protein
MKNNNFWSNYSIESKITLNNLALKLYLKDFWNNVMVPLKDNQKVYIFLKVRFDDNTYASLSHLQTVNKNMFKDLLDIFKGFLDFKAEEYSSKTLTNVIFQYHIFKDNSIKTKLTKSIKLTKLNSFNFSGYNLPLTTELNKWGLILPDEKITIISKKGSQLTYYVVKDNLKHVVQLKNNNNNILLEFTDILGSNSTSFTRIFKNQEFIYKDGKLLLKKLTRKTQFINKIKTNKQIYNKFLTLDIETRTINNIIKPYCISIFNGSKANSFYLSDFKNEDEMLLKAIKSLLRGGYNKYKVYVHNLSNFDGVFLLRILSSIPNTMLDPIIKDGKMINLNFTWKSSADSKDFYRISFRDSYLLLPSSLRKLAKAFAVESKGIFPYLFVNDPNILLNYEGIIPDFKFYSDLSLEDYDLIKNNPTCGAEPWSLRNETIKYCEQDCRTLWQIIDKFNDLIFNKYSLNVHSFSTLPFKIEQ